MVVVVWCWCGGGVVVWWCGGVVVVWWFGVVVVCFILPITEAPQLTMVTLYWTGFHKTWWWWWCGLSSDYRTTPVNIVQLCTGLGCGK